MAEKTDLLDKLAAAQGEVPGAPEVPVAPPPQASAEPTPPAPPAPATPTPPVPSPDIGALQAEIKEYKQTLVQRDAELSSTQGRLAQYARYETERELEPSFQATIRQYVAQGWDEAQAQQMALSLREREILVREGRKAQETAREETKRWAIDVLEMAEKYGVSPRELLKLSPQELKSQVALLGRIAALENQVAEGKKASVPPQTYEGGIGGGAVSADAIVKKYNEGKPLTKVERDILDATLGVNDYLR